MDEAEYSVIDLENWQMGQSTVPERIALERAEF